MRGKSKRPAWEAIDQQDASAVFPRTVAAALRGELVDIWNLGVWQQRTMQWSTLGGQKAMGAAFERLATASSVDPSLARRVTSDVLANWALSLYDDVTGPWDAVIVGVPNGGVAHLATAMGIPLLSQHFCLSLAEDGDPDDARARQEQGAALVRRILARNADLAVIQHYDPLHRRFKAQHTHTLRCKFLDLPRPYEAFLYQNLRPGGTIIFTDCRLSWPMYFVAERHWFQVGSLGSLEPAQFIEGEHVQVAQVQSMAGREPVGNWGVPGQKAFEMPEAEWGAQPPLHSRLARFARENAYNFVALEGAHPSYYASLAFKVWLRLLRRSGTEPQGLLLETYTQTAPAAARRGALLPIWLPGNDEASRDLLQRVLRDLKLAMPNLSGKPALWLPLPAFNAGFDVVPWEDWMATLAGFDVVPMAMRPELYPADPTAAYAAQRAVSDWLAEHPAPVQERAPLDWVLEEARALRRQRS